MLQVCNWLEQLGMSEYASRFVESRIDANVLPELTDQDLEKMGVLLGDRRKMMRSLRAIRSTASPSPAVTSSAGFRREGAQRRQLSVMFCDLVGSTALSSRLDPEDLREIMGIYHRVCTGVIAGSGGFTAKYLGDGVLAYFGYPQAHEDDAERAVRTGLAMIDAIAQLDVPRETVLRVRIGIATGMVVVGDLLGEGVAAEHAVVGQAPNMAARLQGVAAPDTIVIDGTTRRLVGALFECRALDPVVLKGFDGPVPAWQVSGMSNVESRFEALRSAAAPLVGRDKEMQLLTRRWEEAKAGQGNVVLVTGEPGIGKSRFTETVLEPLGSGLQTRLRYFCSPHHQDSSLYPNIVQLRRAAGLRREDTPEQRLCKLEAVLAQATDDLGEAVPILADLLAIPTADRYPSPPLSSQMRKERIFCAQLAQVEGLSAKQPVLMVFEDVHWSDPTTREFLDRLIERVRQLRVLVVITFRPEFVAPWIGLLHVTQISLGRLSLRESGEMVRHVAGAEDLPQEIVDKIIERTDGIPLFIEELTKSVLERGLQRRVGSGGRDTAVIAIPTTLQGSLLARLDRLAPTREVAQIGSAIGRRFSHELISSVADLPPREIDEALAQLVRAELIFASGAPYIEYTFKHALVQEAAYGTMLRSSRQRIHARIAEVLESRFPDIATAQPQLLAHHCSEAGLGEKAVSYHVRAGQLSVARSAMTEAADQLRKGLYLLGSLPPSEQRARQEIELQIALARALMATKGYSAPAVSEALARARGIAEQLRRPDCLLPLLYLQYAYHTVRGEHGLGLTLAKQLEEFGTDGNDDTARLLGRLLRGASCFYLGDFVGARQLFEQCDDLKAPERRAVFAALTAEDPYATSLAWLASTLAFLGHMDQARLRMDEALFEARRLGHVYTLVWVLGMICWIDKAAGCPEQVEGHAKELVSLAGQHGFPLWLARGLLWQGWSSTAMGRPQEGVASLEQGLSLLRKTGASIAAPLALVWLAEAHGKLGRPQDGLDCLSEAARLVESSNERYCEVDLYRVQGELLIARGDTAAAEAVLHRALAIARHQSARTFELRAAVELARLWLGQGKSVQAGELLAPIQVWFAEGHDRPALQEARRLMAELA